jgi:hypothetical protein
MANANFGKPVPGLRYDPKLTAGWGVRGYDWEFSAGVQRELWPRIGIDVSYFRRWFGNFVVMDDLALSSSDFDRFSLNAPRDSRLPDGGGYTVSGLYDLKPARFGTPAQQFVTLAENYGKQTEHWNGVDVNLDARLQNGVLVRGGVSTGKTTTNNCEIVEKVPEYLNLQPAGFTDFRNIFTPSPAWAPAGYCDYESPFLTQIKLLGTYTIPKIDVLVSGTYQTQNGPELVARWVVPSATIAPVLGRPLAGNAPNMTVNIVQPGTMYGDRFHQLDLRFGKVLRIGRARNSVNLDLFNALNASAVTQENVNFAAFRRPDGILPARFAKISWQFDF